MIPIGCDALADDLGVVLIILEVNIGTSDEFGVEVRRSSSLWDSLPGIGYYCWISRTAYYNETAEMRRSSL